MKPLPENSKLVLTRTGRHPSLEIPYPGGGDRRFLMAAYIIAWLGGWLVGEISAIRVLPGGIDRRRARLLGIVEIDRRAAVDDQRKGRKESKEQPRRPTAIRSNGNSARRMVRMCLPKYGYSPLSLASRRRRTVLL